MAKDDKALHYDEGGIDSLDIIKAKLTPEQFKGYLLGSSMKYGLRANFKGSMYRDMDKSSIYSGWVRDLIGEESMATSISALRGEEAPSKLESELDAMFPDDAPADTPIMVEALAARGAKKVYKKLLVEFPKMKPGESVTLTYEFKLEV